MPPTAIVRCRRCVLPASLPSARLDAEGICRPCRDYARTAAEWEQVKSRRQARFARLVANAKARKATYDVVVPLSGGKDSTYALYVCARRYGLRCLCVTFDNGFLSNHAQENIRTAVAAAGADHVFFGLNRPVMLQLYRLFLERCGNFCPVCMRGIAVAQRLLVERFRIPLIVTGDGQRITYSAFIKELFEGGDLAFFRAVLADSPLREQARLLWDSPYRWNLYRLLNALRDRTGWLLAGTSQYVPLWDYADDTADDMYRILETELGWKRTSPSDEHSDCLVHGIIPYIHRLKFPEMTPTTLKNSARIRWGQLTRAEALALEEQQLAIPLAEPPELESFLQEIGMGRDEFHAAVRDWRSLPRWRRR